MTDHRIVAHVFSRRDDDKHAVDVIGRKMQEGGR